MKYSVKRKSTEKVLMLFHGTGGSEEDLFELAKMIDDQATLIGFRGDVDENGMARFFKRKAMGVFDLEDLAYRTRVLKDEIHKVLKVEGFGKHQATAIGYSNGANILASLLFTYENVLPSYILLHPMVPRRDLELVPIKKTPIFIGAGLNDPICPKDETEELTKMLKESGARVTVSWHESGHHIARAEIEQAKAWYEKL